MADPNPVNMKQLMATPKAKPASPVIVPFRPGVTTYVKKLDAANAEVLPGRKPFIDKTKYNDELQIRENAVLELQAALKEAKKKRDRKHDMKEDQEAAV